jgi:glycosyltransferase involved in cell wall biosynthesis
MAVVPVKARVAIITTIPQTLSFLRDQILFLQKEGLTVEVISSSSPILSDFVEELGISSHAIEMSRAISPLADLRALYRLYRYFRSDPPEIVHAYTPKAGIVGISAAVLSAVPIRIYSILGFPYETAGGARRLLLRLVETVTCIGATKVICVSQSIKTVALSSRICRVGKLVVLGSGSIGGVDAEVRFNPAKVSASIRISLAQSLGIDLATASVIGFVGRLVKDKGIEDLASAWEIIRADQPTSHLVVVGRDDTRDAASPEAMAKFVSDDRVHLVGQVKDTVPYFSIFDVLVLPSHREGFPNVALEAAAMGIPVVTTSVTGCRDAVVDGVTGALVPMKCSDCLASAIRKYLADDELRKSHGRAGRARVQQDFRPETIWSAQLEIYKDLLRLKVSDGSWDA